MGCGRKSSPAVDFSSRGVQGVRFDPSYYYGLKQPLGKFVDSAVGAWQGRGINTVFFKAYDPEYGAVYKTRYPGNAKTDYADKDLLRLFIDACHQRGVRLVAWLPVFEHKGAWEAHPEWRMKAADGSDYLPSPEHHPLCVRQEGFRKWWDGFLADLLGRYPDLDGVDFAEPTIVWKGKETCFCPVCRKAITPDGRDSFSPAAVAERAKGLTDLLLLSSRQVKATGRTSCITFIGTSGPDTELLPFSRQKDLTGIDVDALLDSPDRPQWVSVELMWQQWADTYDNPASFRPDWTQKAVEQALAQIGTRAHLLAHVEITPLGPVEVSPAEFVASVAAARRGGAQSIEFYDTHLADSLQAWPTLEKAWRAESERKAVVLHDPEGLGVARQVAVLFGHFGLKTEVALVDSFAKAWVGPNDLVAYVGNQENHPLPAAFLEFAAHPASRLFWADFNLWQLDRPLVGGHGDTNTFKDAAAAPSNGTFARLGFRHKEHRRSTEFPYVAYGGQELFKSDSTLNIIEVTDSARVRVHAVAKSAGGVDGAGSSSPYILQSGNFWYVADCPTDYIEEGGRDIAFADLLHEFVGDLHSEKRTALVRIEDVCPLTDPASLRSIADLLHAKRVPFSIALVPYYVDPEENTAISLSDRPEFVKALRHAVGKGASIILHGSTHQYRGRSTHDFEFWDAIHDTPLLEDSREYVRLRIERGVDEMRKHGFYPIAFETPHYAASQLDYSVIDRHFSAEYGRRQVIDRTGFDQLVPYFIARHPSGNSIIPENLGYVPNDKQVAAPLLRFARNNLAVRDGFASFFFHPWIDRKALTELVDGIRDMGYAFADIRSITLKAQTEGLAHVTGSQEVAIDPKGRRLRTFYLDDRGGKHDEWASSGPVTREFTRTVQCPPGWSFVAEAVDGDKGWLARMPLPGPGFLDKARVELVEAPALKLAKGEPARPLILWSSQYDRPASPGPADVFGAIGAAFPESQADWLRAFAAAGIDADTVTAENFLGVPEAYNLVVVPQRSSRLLSTQQSLILSMWVAKGHAVILEGPSLAAEQMGLRAADSGWTVSHLRDDYLPSVAVKWARPAPYYAFDSDGEYVNQYSTLDDAPLVAGGGYGKGKYLFFATPFTEAEKPVPAAESPRSAANARTGASGAAPASKPVSGPHRFPFLLDMIQRELGLHPALKAPSLEVYFDPGSREDVPIEELVSNWRRNGVRAVYLAGWHEYGKYTFEYDYTVSLLHQGGMLAYAWLDLPGISDRFWQEHPQWREKTAAGTDAEMDDDIGWKQSMNLTNDTCRAGAYNALKRLLMLAPWDGAVLTGRMFSGDDPDSLRRITPFHPSFRARYAKDRGYDPVRIFDKAAPQYVKRSPKAWEEFLAYRDSIEQALTLDVLGFLKSQRTLMQPGAEIVLTRDFAGASALADSLYRRLMAQDPRVRLQASASRKSVDAGTLEDDATALRAAYPLWKPMFEVDLERQKPRSGTTPQLCGMELMELVAAAGRLGTRLSLRTEDFIYDTDFRNLAHAAAASTRESLAGGAWEIRSPGRTSIELDDDANPEVLMDGRAWPAYDRGRLLLPAGNHRLEGAPRLVSWKSMLQAPTRISGFNASITDSRATLQGLRLKYESPHPASLALSMAPLSVTLDGLPYDAGQGKPGAALSLPAGVHLVDIATRPLASALMRQASVGLSVGIILISSLMVLAFGILYVGGAMRRLYAGEAPDPNPGPGAGPGKTLPPGPRQRPKRKIESE